jgi:hypothetical protein
LLTADRSGPLRTVQVRQRLHADLHGAMLWLVTDPIDMPAWRITAASGGWLRFHRQRLAEGELVERDEPTPLIYLRVAKDASGQPGVREAVMISEEPINAASWRHVPFDLARMFATPTSSKTSGPTATAIAEVLGTPGPSLAASLEALFEDSEPPSTLVDRGGASSGSLSVLKPPAEGLTEEFLADLAEAYRELVVAKRAPAPAIAEQTGRPVGTVHRWIGEARKRGHLPPAQRGKAG